MNSNESDVLPDNCTGTKVAIVEDSSTLRNYLAKLVTNAGYRCVCTCGTAEEAMVSIPESNPHVVLMDIHLPGESGIACTAFLRGKMPKVQVIMLTVYKDIGMIFHALKAGACGYLLKRADEKEILEAIAEVRAGGAPMTSQVARMVVRSFEQDANERSQVERLSPREREVLGLVSNGYTNKEVASQLNISYSTVRIHLAHAFEKLHVRCRAEAVAKLLRSAPNSPPILKQPELDARARR